MCNGMVMLILVGLILRLHAVTTNVMKSSISRTFVDILSAQPKLVISQVRLMLQELPTTCVSKLNDGCTNWLTLEER